MIDFEKIRNSFPILNVKVNDNKLVYFDNAATTQTPTQVTNSIRDYFNKQNSNIHRGAHHLSNISTEDFEQSRKKVKEFIGAEKEEEVVFTRGTTDSINLIATSFQSFLKRFYGLYAIFSYHSYFTIFYITNIFCSNHI